VLRDIIILRESLLIYWKQNISSTSWEILSPNVDLIANYLEHGVEDQIYQGEYEDIKFSYLFYKNLKLTFILINDILDDNSSIDQMLKYGRDEFIKYFSADVINTVSNVEIFETFDPVTIVIHKYFKPKIALAGFKSVGKTTIAKLISSDPSNPVLEPALKGEVYPLNIKNLEFDLWDFIGEENLLFLWPKYLNDSDVIIIVTDSTPKIVEKSKFFIDLIQKDIPSAKFAIVANMQDTEEAVKLDELRKLFGFCQIYGMVAKDSTNRDFMVTVVMDILNISGEHSPKVQLMFERSKAILAGERAEIEGQLESALANFKSVTEFSRKLDDHELTQDYLNRIAKLKEKLGTIKEKIPEEITTVIGDDGQSTIPTRIQENKEKELPEVDLLRKNIDKWKERKEEIESDLKNLEYKFMAKMINEEKYQEEKDQLINERSDLDSKLYEARFKIIQLI